LAVPGVIDGGDAGEGSGGAPAPDSAVVLLLAAVAVAAGSSADGNFLDSATNSRC
jgi:hypothetical protein